MIAVHVREDRLEVDGVGVSVGPATREGAGDELGPGDGEGAMDGDLIVGRGADEDFDGGGGYEAAV